MTEIPHVSVGPPAARRIAGRRRRGWTLGSVAAGEIPLATAAVAGASAAVLLTLRAHFLDETGWLALGKANLILGPVVVGLYWRRRRPGSRFGTMLIVLGLVCIPFALQSSPDTVLFGIGAGWQLVVYWVTLSLILAFPTGQLDRVPERLVLGAGLVLVAAPGLAALLVSPHLSTDGSILGCASGCPANGLSPTSAPAAASSLADIARAGILVVAVATSVLLVFRAVSGSSSRRRALAFGAPLALLFVLTQAAYQFTTLVDRHAGSHDALRWTFVVAGSLLWLGWLLALVAAELFAARMLRKIVGESLRPPSPAELEEMLRRPLNDPDLRLAFWNMGGQSWSDAGGRPIGPPQPGAGQAVVEFELDREPAVAILHNSDLSDDPELLEAAGAVALLAREKADLEAAWSESLRELAESRGRIAATTDTERRMLERDLHDGAQQRLLGALLKLDLIAEIAADDTELHRRLGELEQELQAAIDELRELGHGIYPAVLANAGLAGALSALAARSAGRIRFTDEHRDELPSEIEAALYYCCLEAVQNATKHAGSTANISILLTNGPGEVRLEVVDDGPGFDPEARHAGVGLRNMHDRLGAVRGQVLVRSRPARGTTVAAAVPLAR